MEISFLDVLISCVALLILAIPGYILVKTKMLSENRIEFSDIKTYGTPRRLTFIVENISEKQSNLEEEVKGPCKIIQFPTQNSKK